tara:strand:- start:194 stop:835 length:642 start_codon:yes stop_codon:yes gene_type:complete
MGTKKEFKTSGIENKGGTPWILIYGVVGVIALLGVGFYPRFTSEPINFDTDESSLENRSTDSHGHIDTTSALNEDENIPTVTTVNIVKPPSDAVLPPLPFIPNGMPRTTELINEVYEFAGRNPDILEFVPCFCGCESAGHQANAHCFVESRNSDGTVRTWENHGMGCAVCIDVARDSMQLHASGASVKDVRTSIETKYASRFPRMTPTPEPSN